MAGHSEGVGSRHDLGNRVFVGWAFIPVGLSLVMNALAFGQTHNLLVVGWGLLTLAVLLTLANALHSGSRRAERVTLIVGGVYLLLAIGEAAFAWGSAEAFHVVFQCLMPPLLALMLALTPIRYFMAAQRGDSVEKFERDLTGAAYSLPRIVYISCAVLIGLAVFCAFFTIDLLVPAGYGTSMLVVGFLGVLVGGVLFVFGRNWRYFAKSQSGEPGYREIVIGDARTLFNCLVIVTSLIGLIVIGDLM